MAADIAGQYDKVKKGDPNAEAAFTYNDFQWEKKVINGRLRELETFVDAITEEVDDIKECQTQEFQSQMKRRIQHKQEADEQTHDLAGDIPDRYVFGRVKRGSLDLVGMGAAPWNGPWAY